jgi:large-conductance mechanosensitive channel
MVMDAELTTFVMRGSVPDLAVEATTGGTREIVSALVIGMLLPPMVAE